MMLKIQDRAELKRIRKLLTTFDNKSVTYPIMFYRGEDQTVAFTQNQMDREFSVTIEGTVQHYQMSDRPGARMEWIDKNIERIKKRVKELNL